MIDNGVGIPPENLTRIFSHGFTTRKGGHGFGLHGGALVTSVDGRPIDGVASLKAVMTDVEGRRPAHVAFRPVS